MASACTSVLSGSGRLALRSALWPARRRALPVRLTIALSLALAAPAAPASAGEEAWTRLNGVEIADALAARSMAFDNGATQEFRQNGETTYDSARPAQGLWKVSDDQYCSNWPPSDQWDCYVVERSASGLDLRFTSRDGGYTIGRYTDLQ